MRAPRLAVDRSEQLTLLAGAALTLAAAVATTRIGATAGLGALLAAALFFGLVTAFVAAPHAVVAATVPLFAAIPALKVLVLPTLGPVKDVVVLAGAAAVALVMIQRTSVGLGRRADVGVAALVAALLGLYVLNVGGLLGGNGLDLAWVQGIRLVAEPLFLLVIGLALDRPERTLRWTMAALIGTACAEATIGILQQVVGQFRLVELGYSFEEQVRTINGRLRSFGTMDEPFAYAAFLMLGLTAVLFWMRRGPVAVGAGVLILAGVALSFVRSAAIVAVALLALWVARRGFTAAAVLLGGASVAAAGAILIASPGATESRTVRQGESLYFTLNGRTEAWQVVLGSPSTWAFGRGVGEVGTAAERATFTVSRTDDEKEEVSAVDSGYFATIADVGAVGLLVLMTLFARLITLGRRAIGRGQETGWLAIGFLAVLLLDAVTRASFTGFPTAFLGLLLVGLSLGAARSETEGDARLPAARESR